MITQITGQQYVLFEKCVRLQGENFSCRVKGSRTKSAKAVRLRWTKFTKQGIKSEERGTAAEVYFAVKTCSAVKMCSVVEICHTAEVYSQSEGAVQIHLNCCKRSQNGRFSTETVSKGKRMREWVKEICFPFSGFAYARKRGWERE